MGSLRQRLSDFSGGYDGYKRALEEFSGASEALLHVHAGLLIFILVSVLRPQRMASMWPLSTVMLVALLNEAIDYLGPSRSAYWSSVGDVINTVFWPALLFLIARLGSFKVKA